MDATRTSRRLLSARETADRLGRSPSWFSARETKKALDEAGFPRPVPVANRWCPRAIDRWIDAQQRDSVADDEDPFVAAMRNGA